MNHQPMPHQLEALDAGGRGLRVRFFWQHDRYAHVIEAIGPDAIQPLVASAVSDAGDQWPDDPPLQQLSIEAVGDNLAALGVGQAGRSHWSISVEARPGDCPALRFDIACRCTDPPPQRLGSRYRDLIVGRQPQLAEDQAVWLLDGRALRVQVDTAIGPARLMRQADPPVLRIAAAEGEAAAGPASAAAATGPRTLRWGFLATLTAG